MLATRLVYRQTKDAATDHMKKVGQPAWVSCFNKVIVSQQSGKAFRRKADYESDDEEDDQDDPRWGVDRCVLGPSRLEAPSFPPPPPPLPPRRTPSGAPSRAPSRALSRALSCSLHSH